MTQLANKYRPATWSDLIGQDAIRDKVNNLRARGIGGRAFWLSGPSGTGKTTIALLLAGEVAADINVAEIDAADVTLDWIRDFAQSRFQRGLPIDGDQRIGRAVIVNESHTLRGPCVSRLLTLLENLPEHIVFVFTCQHEGTAALIDAHDDGPALMSRCQVYNVAQRALTDTFAAALVRGARAEGLLNGKGDDYYVTRAKRLLKDLRNNMRAAWQQVDNGFLTDRDEE